MQVTDFSTRNLPAKERFDSWCALTGDTLTPSTLRSEQSDNFFARIRMMDLGLIRLSELRYAPMETHRSAKLIRRSDPEAYQLMLTLRGGHRILQAGRDTACSPGEFMLYDSSRPWHGWATNASGILLQFPRQILPLPQNGLRSLTASRFPGRDGIAALLAVHIQRMAVDIASYTAADAERLASITMDLVAALCAAYLEREELLPQETHRHVLMLRILAFIEQHLSDPKISPADIAAAHYISVRHLHRLFQGKGTTVTATIRQRRLEHCRRDLTDPRYSDRTVVELAARWGLTDKAHFNRRFKEAYGDSPGRYRHAHTVVSPRGNLLAPGDNPEGSRP
ncbi:helix-turn-helix domain-containing protein [Streptomyces xiamenensis]|uniref:AraC-like ligand-binding domain-containing protein n=1 Tax=Streptomyces TaxID=1883 RepID=UPI000694784D|nr:helix-turn-helix domain-containing protein [Streptomyces sp. NRRL F-2890]